MRIHPIDFNPFYWICVRRNAQMGISVNRKPEFRAHYPLGEEIRKKVSGRPCGTLLLYQFQCFGISSLLSKELKGIV